jgi:hypothetical protein
MMNERNLVKKVPLSGTFLISGHYRSRHTVDPSVPACEGRISANDDCSCMHAKLTRSEYGPSVQHKSQKRTIR